MNRFLFISLLSLFGCKNSDEDNLTSSIIYVRETEIVDEIKRNQEVLNFNFNELLDRRVESSNSNEHFFVLDIIYNTEIPSNIDSLTYFLLVPITKNLSIKKKDKDKFLFNVKTENLNNDSILFDVYICNSEKRYINDYVDIHDTVNQIFILQRKEYLGNVPPSWCANPSRSVTN